MIFEPLEHTYPESQEHTCPVCGWIGWTVAEIIKTHIQTEMSSFRAVRYILANRYICLTLAAAWIILRPLLWCNEQYCMSPVLACHSDPPLSHVLMYLPLMVSLGAIALRKKHQPTWEQLGGGARREGILIVISLANDLWSIFRLEPYDLGGSESFPWMRNEAVVSPAPTIMVKSMQSPPLRDR